MDSEGLKICLNCNVSNRADAVFCFKCGTKIIVQSSFENPPMESSQIEKTDVIGINKIKEALVPDTVTNTQEQEEASPEIVIQVDKVEIAETITEDTASIEVPVKALINVCPACNNENKPEARFCRTCGEKIQAQVETGIETQIPVQTPGWVCASCNGQNKPESRFCCKCGSKRADGGNTDKPVIATSSDNADVPVLTGKTTGALKQFIQANAPNENKPFPFQTCQNKGVCDVCDTGFGAGEAFRVPLDVSYSSSKYKESINNNPLAKSAIQIAGGVDAYLAAIRANDKTPHSAVCKKCIDMFIVKNKTCSNCHASVKSGLNFCNFCGSKMV